MAISVEPPVVFLADANSGFSAAGFCLLFPASSPGFSPASACLLHDIVGDVGKENPSEIVGLTAIRKQFKLITVS